MNYSEKLLDPRWKAKRHEILMRDDWTCHKCGDNKRRKAVHHLYYIWGREPWEYDNECLITICVCCHLTHHMLESIGKAFGFTEKDNSNIDDLFFSASPQVMVEDLFKDFKIIMDKYNA